MTSSGPSDPCAPPEKVRTTETGGALYQGTRAPERQRKQNCVYTATGMVTPAMPAPALTAVGALRPVPLSSGSSQDAGGTSSDDTREREILLQAETLEQLRKRSEQLSMQADAPRGAVPASPSAPGSIIDGNVDDAVESIFAPVQSGTGEPAWFSDSLAPKEMVPAYATAASGSGAGRLASLPDEASASVLVPADGAGQPVAILERGPQGSSAVTSSVVGSFAGFPCAGKTGGIRTWRGTSGYGRAFL